MIKRGTGYVDNCRILSDTWGQQPPSTGGRQQPRSQRSGTSSQQDSLFQLSAVVVKSHGNHGCHCGQSPGRTKFRRRVERRCDAILISNLIRHMGSTTPVYGWTAAASVSALGHLLPTGQVKSHGNHGCHCGQSPGRTKFRRRVERRCDAILTIYQQPESPPVASSDWGFIHTWSTSSISFSS
jgi:hypothetical protein